MNRAQRTQAVPDTTSSTAVPRLSAKEFLAQYIRSQTSIMDGMLQMMIRGEIALDATGADELIDAIMEKWMASEEPSFKLQMKAQAAIFLDELLEALHEAREPENETEPEEPKPQQESRVSPNAVKITVEVLKTVRSIWGK